MVITHIKYDALVTVRDRPIPTVFRDYDYILALWIPEFP